MTPPRSVMDSEGSGCETPGSARMRDGPPEEPLGFADGSGDAEGSGMTADGGEEPDVHEEAAPLCLQVVKGRV